jgi:hypothetical protein
MFSASSLYFFVAIFGKSFESDETHNETSETPQQHLQEEQALAQNASESNQIIGSIFTNQRIILCLLNSYHRSLK